MNKFLALLVIFGAIVSAAPLNENDSTKEIFGEYTFFSGYTLFWTVSGSNIIFNATNTRNAWAGFGLNIYGPTMGNADIYAISNVGGVSTVGDYLSLGYAPPTADTSLGCTNDVQNWSGSIGSTTWYTFTRAINTGDATCDYVIQSGPNTVVWAFGYSGMTAFDYHEQRGSASIDFLAGGKQN